MCLKNDTLQVANKVPSGQRGCSKDLRGDRESWLVIFARVHLYYLVQYTEVDPAVKIPQPAFHQCDALI